MREIRVKGTYTEMGETFGRHLSNWHRKFVPNEKLLEFTQKCEEAVSKFAPDILEEIRGISKSSGTSYEALTATMLAPAFAFGCTLFAVKGEYTKNGSPVFARHMDWIREDIGALCTIYANPDDGHSSIGFSFGDCGRYGGQNEEGLTIGSAALPMYNGKMKPGVRMNISTRWVLDKFSTTEQAVAYLKRVPHTEAVSFLVADKSGTIARVEAAPERTEAELIEKGIGIATNVFVMDETKHLDDGLPEDSHVYDYIRRLERWYDDTKGEISLDSVKAICCDPEEGICQINEAHSITIWSWVAETNPASIEIAPGPPCEVDHRLVDG